MWSAAARALLDAPDLAAGVAAYAPWERQAELRAVCREFDVKRLVGGRGSGAKKTPQLLLLDVQENSFYTSPATGVTAEVLTAFLAAHREEKLERKRFGA